MSPRLTVNVTSPDGQAALARGLGLWLSKAAPASARGEVTVALISDGRMRSLNRSFRGQDRPTDVLSFGFDADRGARRGRGDGLTATPGEPARRQLGDVVIAVGVARSQARAANHSVATELRVLALHGLLHLLGYDHEADAGRMARAEARLRRRAGLREGLIDRAHRSREGRPARRQRLRP
jgi:probable rRNA maturation factor